MHGSRVLAVELASLTRPLFRHPRSIAHLVLFARAALSACNTMALGHGVSLKPRPMSKKYIAPGQPKFVRAPSAALRPRSKLF